MSGLAAVLAGRHDTGVYRWHAAFAAADVAHTVEHAGWSFAHLDAWPTDSKAEFLARIATALDFPEHFGGNLDALADCLSDVRSDTVVLWDGWGPFAHADERAFGASIAVLNERSRHDKHGRFVVLLRGDGPDLPELTSLD